jgi:hypothetical protein
VIVKSLSVDNNSSTESWNILRRIKEILALDWDTKIIYVYKEANKCVDIIANISCEH